MDSSIIEDIDNDVIAHDISDEALEAAAGAASDVAIQVTLAACTGVWSTFCNS